MKGISFIINRELKFLVTGLVKIICVKLFKFLNLSFDVVEAYVRCSTSNIIFLVTYLLTTNA